MTYVIPVIRQEKKRHARSSTKSSAASRSRIVKIAALILIPFVIITATIPLCIYLSGAFESRRGDDLTDREYYVEFRETLEYKVAQWRQELNSTDADSQERSMPERGYIMQELIQEMKNRNELTFDEMLDSSDNKLMFNSVVNDLCDPSVTCSQEVTSSPYRTFDGSCNNLDQPQWGASNRKQRRDLLNTYEDDIGLPRQHSILGGSLPSARVVSNTMLKPHPVKQTDNYTTVMVMTFGQFFSHDISLTPVMEGRMGKSIDCCNKNYVNAMSGPFGACLPVDLPADDNYFRSSTCMTFVRSAPALCEDCELCRREPLNRMTSYIDASQVYGGTQEMSNNLRAHTKGLMIVKGDSDMLPFAKNEACRLTSQTQHCFLAGDKRVNVVPNLSSMHIMFVRYHNVVVKRLADMYPTWNDDLLFKQTRKIVIGIMQNIVYSEYLPVVLGPTTMNRFGLDVKENGHDLVYDVTIDATVSNSFSTAAFRFGHSTIPDKQIALDEQLHKECTSPIEETYNNPNMTYLFCDGVARWMGHVKGITQDGNFGAGVRNLLFKDKGVSFDLPARNIQRGRDHGIPTYNQWRQFCGLQVLTQADFRLNGAKMGDFSVETSENCRKAYKHPDDIDLFSGGIKEELLPGAQVGPVFACILGMQFHRLKYGDRFYFENPIQSDSPNIGFTAGQLIAIKKVQLSRVSCVTMHSPTTQADVFRPPSHSNPMKNCSELEDIDLTAWQNL